jgi:LysM repeat protein
MGSVRRSNWKQYIPYLLLNVAISVGAVSLVLFFWTRRPKPPELVPTPTKNIATEIAGRRPTPTATLPPSPTPHVYEVKPGDTLYGIALELEISVDGLMAANNLLNPDEISVGTLLTIPSLDWIERYEERLATQVAIPTATATPYIEPPNVEIRGVEGPGDLETEAIRFQNTGGVADMEDWRLDDGEGHIYRFPAFTLHRGGFNLNTREGEDTPIDLYWGLDTSILLSGKTLKLIDARGQVHSSFAIP